MLNVFQFLEVQDTDPGKLPAFASVREMSEIHGGYRQQAPETMLDHLEF